jgi:SNF2 family DNA or RNA helicase
MAEYINLAKKYHTITSVLKNNPSSLTPSEFASYTQYAHVIAQQMAAFQPQLQQQQQQQQPSAAATTVTTTNGVGPTIITAPTITTTINNINNSRSQVPFSSSTVAPNIIRSGDIPSSSPTKQLQVGGIIGNLPPQLQSQIQILYLCRHLCKYKSREEILERQTLINLPTSIVDHVSERIEKEGSEGAKQIYEKKMMEFCLKYDVDINTLVPQTGSWNSSKTVTGTVSNNNNNRSPVVGMLSEAAGQHRHPAAAAMNQNQYQYRQQQEQLARYNNMKVEVNRKRGRYGDLDDQFVAEETVAENHADEILRKCQEVSNSLRKALGDNGISTIQGTGAAAAANAAIAYAAGTMPDNNNNGNSSSISSNKKNVVDQKQLIEACGDTGKYLKPYQIVGINFLLLLYNSKVGGAILADEMGLGKTAQIINYLGALKELVSLNKDPGPHLVVVPPSLLENWQRELRRWCPSLTAIVYYGKHRSVLRKRLVNLRERMARGEDISVEDDLHDLSDPDVLAQLAHEAGMEGGEGSDDSDEEGDNGATDEDGSDEDVQMNLHKLANADGSESEGEEHEPEKKKVSVLDFDAPLSPAPFNIMLTCYTLFERDSPEQKLDRKFLESWRFSHLIMDEAHALKNKNAARFTRLQKTAVKARCRVMITGTPLQNDLAELQNLLQFLLPQIFSEQKLSGDENFADLIQDERKVKDLTNRMKAVLGPFVLRRLKAEVANQLTEKTHSTEFIVMTSEQSGLYEQALSSMRSSMLNNGKAAGAIQDGTQKGYEKFLKSLGGKKISHMFTHLRKIAQHPLLIRALYDQDKVKKIAEKAYERQLFSGGNVTLKKIQDELLSYSDYSLHAFCYNGGVDFDPWRLPTSAMLSSSKFQFLQDLLPKLKAAGSRPLIFSQWTSVLDLIEWLLDVLRLPYVRLDGSTAVDTRLAIVDRFNTASSDEVFAFLLSTRAGGQGLNLTGADTVILHDVDFNPQIDKQAEDRCHRLGQSKPVRVYRLVTKATVDQNIHNLSQRKLKLDSAVLDGITAGVGAQRKEAAANNQQMGMILHGIMAGTHVYDEDGEKRGGEEEGGAGPSLAAP